MEPRKQAIIGALRAFVRQRPGLEFANYGDVSSYRAESRRIAMDKRHAETLLSAVAENDGITADMLVSASESAYSGRLILRDVSRWFVDYADGSTYNAASEQDARDHWSRCAGRNERGDGTLRSVPRFAVDYCTGQYFPTEYRKAVCAVLASALWYHVREHCMPAPFTPPLCSGDWYAWKDGSGSLPLPLSAGDWLRAYFRREFGRTIASRYFN